MAERGRVTPQITSAELALMETVGDGRGEGV